MALLDEDFVTLEQAYEANPWWFKAVVAGAKVMIDRRKKYSGGHDPYFNFALMAKGKRTILDVFLFYTDIKRARLEATQTDFEDESLLDTLIDFMNYAILLAGWFLDKRNVEDVK